MITLEIQQLQYRYARGVDSRDIDAILSCFTLDAHVAFNGGEIVVAGHAEIRRFFEQAYRGPLLGVRGRSTHALTNIVVDPTADGTSAHSDTHGIAYLASDERDQIIVRGLNYGDDCTLTTDGWRIARRVHTALWEGQMPSRPLSPALERR